MATKDILDSNQAKKSKPAANMNLEGSKDNTNQKKNAPCKNSLPT